MLTEATLRGIRAMAGRAARPMLADEIRINREGQGRPVYVGPARFSRAKAPEAVYSDVSGTQVRLFAYVEIPNGSPQVERDDTVTVIRSVEPALVNRTVYVLFPEPIDTWAGVVRFSVQLS